MSTNFTAVNGLLAGIPKLKSDNWFEWYKKMNMFFLGAGVTGISSGKAPTEKSALEKWEATNRQMTAFIYLKVEDEFQSSTSNRYWSEPTALRYGTLAINSFSSSVVGPISCDKAIL